MRLSSRLKRVHQKEREFSDAPLVPVSAAGIGSRICHESAELFGLFALIAGIRALLWFFTRKSVEVHDPWAGVMPNFFMRDIKVVRFNPRRVAAPFGPPTRPPVSLSTRRI